MSLHSMNADDESDFSPYQNLFVRVLRFFRYLLSKCISKGFTFWQVVKTKSPAIKESGVFMASILENSPKKHNND